MSVLSLDELHKCRDAAVTWAQKSGEIQLRYLHSSEKDVQHKGAIDLVTAADKACEQFLVEQIERAFPSHGYVAEEGHAKAAGSGLTWYIDPLDGTTNYAHGYPMFATSIALVDHGVPVVGVVHDPTRPETFSAVRGGGAWLNGDRLHVTTEEDIAKSLLVSGFPYNFKDDARNLRLWSAFLHNALSVRRDGSAALDLCYVAGGRFDGFWELNLKSWDVAAGIVILEEAGGKVSQFDGTAHHLEARNILATNGRLHAAMQKIIATHIEEQ
jgi:myo-inositol-1(or 4)-monophosphatase